MKVKVKAAVCAFSLCATQCVCAQGMLFPVNNPSAASDWAAFAQFSADCDRVCAEANRAAAQMQAQAQFQQQLQMQQMMLQAQQQAQANLLQQQQMMNMIDNAGRNMPPAQNADLINGAANIGANLPGMLAYGAKVNEACAKGRWSTAVRHSRKVCALSSSARERVLNYTQLAILCWNAEMYDDAVEAMDEVVAACGQIAPDCDANARKFRRAIQKRKIGGKFSVEEATTIIGVWDAVYSIPNAIVENNLRNWMVYIDGEINKLRHDGAMMARAAKRKATAEYTEKTGKEFYPDDPPMRGTRARVHWDAANRVYQIFE